MCVHNDSAVSFNRDAIFPLISGGPFKKSACDCFFSILRKKKRERKEDSQKKNAMVIIIIIKIQISAHIYR